MDKTKIYRKCEFFSWGANSHGQNGLGHEVDQNEPSAINLSCVSTNLANINLIVGGGGHSAILYGSNVYTCGLNENGQLGNEILEKKTFKNSFKLVNEIQLLKISEVACGWDFTIAVSNVGVFSWGSNAHGQLGIEENVRQSFAPVKIKSLEGKNVMKIGAGLRHSVAMSEEEIWAWGDNKKGQCSSSCANNFHIPNKINLPDNSENFKSVSCGSFHNILLLGSGNSYGWGCNRKGQLATDPSNEKTVIAATKLKHPKLKSVKCGWTHNVGINADGDALVTWGRGDYGQLGRPCENRCYDFSPECLEIEGHFTDICCGSEHSLALTEGGLLYSWGWNEHGMCGIGHEKNVTQPTQVPFFNDKKVSSIGSGAGHSFAVVLT